MRILAIHAHPDDVEILAGGTLAQLSALGHQLTIVSMTPGDCGTKHHPPDEIAAIRRMEAAAAAALINAKYICAEFRDMAIFSDDAARRKTTEILREAQPEIVITASPADYHCDHEATSMLVRDACFAAPAPNYLSGIAGPLSAIPHLYFMDSIEGLDRDGRALPPDFIVDVTAYFETKKRMLACHQSQMLWLKEHHGMDNYLDSMEKWTRERGRQAHVLYGEGFRRYPCHPYPQTEILAELVSSVKQPSRT
jgi:LmbE family N-acetylglucosaminyl deacetylase